MSSDSDVSESSHPPSVSFADIPDLVPVSPRSENGTGAEDRINPKNRTLLMDEQTAPVSDVDGFSHCGSSSLTRYRNTDDEFRVVDLFCGAGGVSCGAWQAGGTLVAGVDEDEQALATHAENLPGEHIHHDLAEVDPSILPTTDIHYLHGSPPCPGFSSANTNRKLDDERNQLVWTFIDWCEAIAPPVATMENVPGMETISDHWMERIISAFDSIGYTARWRILNAADYGVPQSRRRIFVVAVRDDASLSSPSRWFPSSTHAKSKTTTLDGRILDEWVTAREAINDIAPIHHGDHLTGQINEAHQLNGRRPMPTVDEPAHTIRAGTPPQWRPQSSPPTERGERPSSEQGRSIQHLTQFSEDGERHPPRTIRRLTVRETARLQSFNDWFSFTGPKTARLQQVGNAVPPRLAQHMTAHIHRLFR